MIPVLAERRVFTAEHLPMTEIPRHAAILAKEDFTYCKIERWSTAPSVARPPLFSGEASTGQSLEINHPLMLTGRLPQVYNHASLKIREP